ncbi:SURF1 family protein [Rhodoplanes roseus]|uniref:SURF1 family protein n=1 Tax=Rhodoplanes roseus TaxID=29409 RepID=UPI001FE1BDF5|nr:SURF1 family protein [Rhodoplanes roseus]
MPASATAPAALPRRRLLGPAIVSLVGVTILIGLGVWQLERMAWKQALIATLTERLAAEPVPMPAPATWAGLSREATEFRRVRVTGEFLHDKEALVYAVGSGSRTATGGLGYMVFTPLKLADGRLVLVDRGFVPDADKAPEARAAGQVRGPVELVGLMRWPEQRSVFAPSDDPARNIWFARDTASIAAAKGVDVPVFYLDLEAPPAPGGLPRPLHLQPNLPNNHLQYAITWFSLALALAVIFFVWAFGRRGSDA